MATKTVADGLLWLDEQMRMLGVDDKELGRRGDFDASAISHARYGRRGIGPKAAKGIAKGLGVPRAVVEQEFGLDDDKSGGYEEEAELFVELLTDIEDDAKRNEAVGLVTVLLRQVARNARKGGASPDRKGGKSPRRAATAD